MPDQGEIVLIPVPLTDLSSRNKRPVVIISNDNYNRSGSDVVTVAMTSNPSVSPFGFQITSADLIRGQLNRPGMVRPDKIYTLAKTIIVKSFGKVSPAVIAQIRDSIERLTEPSS